MHLLEKFYEDFSRIAQLDWSQFHKFNAHIENFLVTLASRQEILSSLTKNLLANRDLLSLSGENPLLKKLILYKDVLTGTELRLHIFKEGVIDKPHDHRLSFSTMVLNGSYRHTLLSTKKDINELLKIEDLSILLSHDVRENSLYSINHDAIHVTEVVPETVSLSLRGPYMKEKWFNIDTEKNNIFFFGDSNLPTSFSYTQLQDTIDFLRQKHLIIIGD